MPKDETLFESTDGNLFLAYLVLREGGANVPPNWIKRYLRLLQEPKRWAKLAIKVDRERFTAELDAVRYIRNDVMHFDPDGVGDEALATLRRFASFLQRLGAPDSSEN